MLLLTAEDARLDDVIHSMERYNIKRLPVMRRGKVVGIASRANLMRALASFHRGAPKSSKRDARIRERILAEIAQQSWSSDALVDVTARDGIADIWSTITALRM